MALIRRDIPATTKDVYGQQWLFTLVEDVELEEDDGRRVFIAQATGKRMTRGEDGGFVGLDGSAVTESDLAEGFLTPAKPVRRLEMQILFHGRDEPCKIENLKDAVPKAQFKQIAAILRSLTDEAVEQTVQKIDDGHVVADEKDPLDKL